MSSHRCSLSDILQRERERFCSRTELEATRRHQEYTSNEKSEDEKIREEKENEREKKGEREERQLLLFFAGDT